MLSILLSQVYSIISFSYFLHQAAGVLGQAARHSAGLIQAVVLLVQVVGLLDAQQVRLAACGLRHQVLVGDEVHVAGRVLRERVQRVHRRLYHDALVGCQLLVLVHVRVVAGAGVLQLLHLLVLKLVALVVLLVHQVHSAESEAALQLLLHLLEVHKLVVGLVVLLCLLMRE